MNHKCRVLELYSIKWNFDISCIDKREFEKLEDGQVEEDESPYAKPTGKKGSNKLMPDGSYGD